MARADELRLVARVARMYFVDCLKQTEIADTLHMSQASISRLLQRARDEKIVRISVEAPRGTYPELEDSLCRHCGLKEAIVADCEEDRDEPILARIGQAAAHYLEMTLKAGEIIGISSWSESLLRMVDNIHPLKRVAAGSVVQILGGMGDPGVQAHATILTRRLAQLTGAMPHLLAVPGIAASAEARDALTADRFVRATFDQYPQLTVALVGIGTVEPSKLLRDSGNIFTDSELDELARLGAVGDICLHFFDAGGQAITSSFDARVIGIELAQLRDVPRVIAVAGGRRKFAAIAGALRGGLVDVLITDSFTARRLASLGHDKEKIDAA